MEETLESVWVDGLGTRLIHSFLKKWLLTGLSFSQFISHLSLSILRFAKRS